MHVSSHALKALIAGCARGDGNARTTFQEMYGPLIYSFPVRIAHLPADEAGNFYLYVFDKDRIFRKISTFEGRNAIQFETYLSYYVLNHLFLEWLRTTDHVDTVSLDMPSGPANPDGDRTQTIRDILPTPEPTPEAALSASQEAGKVASFFRRFDASKGLVLKLLALDTIGLAPDDIRLLAQTASRSIHETLERLEEVKAGLAAKSKKAEKKRQTLHTVFYWILTYQRRLAAVKEHLRVSDCQGAAEATAALTQEMAELERRLDWRYRQQAKLRAELQTYAVRPSYQEIASLLNVPLGTICSRIDRAREVFAHQWAKTSKNAAPFVQTSGSESLCRAKA